MKSLVARISLVLMIFLIAGCKNPFVNPFGGLFGGGDSSRPSAEPSRVVEPTGKFAMAIGGVALGRDELVIYDKNGEPRHFSSDLLSCESEKDIIEIEERPGFESASDGSGVRIIAKSPGVTAVRCTFGDIEMEEVYEVTVPPQSLIQILVAEAGGQIADEAELDDDYDDAVVKLSSRSPTAELLASVIKNRILIINSENNPSLFAVKESDYDSDAPTSYYDSVILADGQFSPTDPEDVMHNVFKNAANRDNLSADWQIAYDQAVLTAAAIFNGDIQDDTGESFGFFSPDEDTWNDIWNAFRLGQEIPDSSPFTDYTFEELAPIQLLLHPDVKEYSDGRPAFIFARQRGENDFAIEDTP